MSAEIKETCETDDVNSAAIETFNKWVWSCVVSCKKEQIANIGFIIMTKLGSVFEIFLL